MPRARGVAPDALRLTERTNAAPFLGKVVGDDLRAQQLLAGFGATYGQAEERESSRAARFLIRKGRNDEDRALLLDAIGLSWQTACPTPNEIEEPTPEPVWNATKDCSRCRQVRSLDDFPADSTAGDDHHSWCKDCHQAVNAAYRQAQADAPKQTPAEQECCRCHQTRPAGLFGKDKTTKTGLAPRCRPCRSEVDKASRTRKKQRTHMERTSTP